MTEFLILLVVVDVIDQGFEKELNKLSTSTVKFAEKMTKFRIEKKKANSCRSL